MRDIGVESQFRLSGLIELFVERLLVVALTFKFMILLDKHFLLAAVEPEHTQEKEEHDKEESEYRQSDIEERGLYGMLVPIMVDLRFQFLYLGSLLLERLVLQIEDVGIGLVDGGSSR